MSGKSMVNMQIVVEKVENMDEFLVRGGYYGSGIDMEHLVLDVLLSIDELFHRSVGLEVKELTEKKTKGKIVVNMQIAAEEIETLGGLRWASRGGFYPSVELRIKEAIGIGQ